MCLGIAVIARQAVLDRVVGPLGWWPSRDPSHDEGGSNSKWFRGRTQLGIKSFLDRVETMCSRRFTTGLTEKNKVNIDC